MVEKVKDQRTEGEGPTGQKGPNQNIPAASQVHLHDAQLCG